MERLTRCLNKSVTKGKEVILELERERDELQICQFLVGFHLFKNKLKEVKEKNSIETTRISISIYENGCPEWSLGCTAYSLKMLADSDREYLKVIDSEIYESLSSMCSMLKNNYGDIITENFDLPLNEVDDSILERFILGGKLSKIYRNSLLNIELSHNKEKALGCLKI